jgi:drug/metabolite transporter (DMT)-like permease
MRVFDPGAVALMTLICLFWGLNQVAVKFSLAEFPPFLQAAIRSCGGLALILVWTWWRGIALMTRDGTFIPGMIAGALFGLEFIMIFYGLTLTSASHASLFIYTAPFFVALAAPWVLPGERLALTQWLGLAFCFVGVASALGFSGAADARTMFGDGLMVGAGAAWAATTLTIKSTALASVAPEKTLIYQIVVSVPMFAAASLFMGEHVTPSGSVVPLSWLLYQIGVVGLTFPIWFAFIQRYSATQVSAFTFLTPLFGVAAGCLLLGEPFTVNFAIAVGLVLAGLILVNQPRRG